MIGLRKGIFRKAAAVLAGVMLLTSCKSDVVSVDILSQKVAQKGKTQITILVKYAFSINAFEKAVEEKFPDIDIVQVGNYTTEMGMEEYKARLKNDDLTDIVMTWPLEVGEEYHSERLIDLSGMDFTNRYSLSTLNSISRDGKLYYIPGPAQIRGILYNKTLFEENGWKVPSDFEGFINLCKEIEKSGIRALQLGFKNPEVLDTAFIGFNYADYFSKPQDTQWISNYNKGVGSFGEHFGGALDVFSRMIDEGIFKESDLNVKYPEREQMLFTRKCAMVEDSVLMARMGFEQTGTTDEFALMPFFNPGNGEDWARLYMVCYIGLNKHLEESENKEKYDKILKIMDYISTKEGQSALSADTGGTFSSFIGSEAPDVVEIHDLKTALNHGRYAIFPTLKNAQNALREGLAGMLNGTLSKEQVIKKVDLQNRSTVTEIPPKKYAGATEDFTIIETGNFVTDAMRDYAGTEIALFLDNGKDGKYNGKGISARLYKGDVTETDLLRILPDLKRGEKGVLYKAEISGYDLFLTLEHAVPVDNKWGGWFYYFSGLKMEYDPTAAAGSRIKKITLTDGTAIEKEKTYKIAVMDGSVPENYFMTCEKTDTTIFSILCAYAKKLAVISPSKDGRFIVG